LAAVREASGQLVFREIEDRDLGVLFEHASDRDAIRMAAFIRRRPMIERPSSNGGRG
jgi:hypothetical protein